MSSGVPAFSCKENLSVMATADKAFGSQDVLIQEVNSGFPTKYEQTTVT